MVNEIINILSAIPKFLTEKTTELLVNSGFNVNQRWTSGLYLLLSLVLIFIAMKLSKPVVKWIIIILAVLILAGLFIPFW